MDHQPSSAIAWLNANVRDDQWMWLLPNDQLASLLNDAHDISLTSDEVLELLDKSHHEVPAETRASEQVKRLNQLYLAGCICRRSDDLLLSFITLNDLSEALLILAPSLIKDIVDELLQILYAITLSRSGVPLQDALDILLASAKSRSDIPYYLPILSGLHFAIQLAAGRTGSNFGGEALRPAATVDIAALSSWVLRTAESYTRNDSGLGTELTSLEHMANIAGYGFQAVRFRTIARWEKGFLPASLILTDYDNGCRIILTNCANLSTDIRQRVIVSFQQNRMAQALAQAEILVRSGNFSQAAEIAGMAMDRLVSETSSVSLSLHTRFGNVYLAAITQDGTVRSKERLDELHRTILAIGDNDIVFRVPDFVFWYQWRVARLFSAIGLEQEALWSFKIALRAAPQALTLTWWLRARLIVADIALQAGDPAWALELAQDTLRIMSSQMVSSSADLSDLYGHAHLVLAEALLILGRPHEAVRSLKLDLPFQVDRPEQHVPSGARYWAALGRSIFQTPNLQIGDRQDPQMLLRRATEELIAETRRESPLDAWDYWFRPADFDARPIIEWALEAELSAGSNDAAVFLQLERLKNHAQSRSFASTVGFRANLALSTAEQARLREILEDLRKVESRLPVADLSDKANLAKERDALLFEAEGLFRAEHDARGYLGDNNWLSVPDLDDVVRILAKRNAAAVELFFSKATQHWGVFVVTGDGSRLLYPFPDERRLQAALTQLAPAERRTSGAADSSEDPRIVEDPRLLTRHALNEMSAALLEPLKVWLRGKHEVYFAPDGETWLVPFAALEERRWRCFPFPWQIRTPLGSGYRVSCVVSIAHLYKLLQLEDAAQVRLGQGERPTAIAIGSSGDDDARVLAEALTQSLSIASEGQQRSIWKILLSDEATADNICATEGDYDLAVYTWHTNLTGNRHTVADFQVKGPPLSFGRFIAATKIRARIGLILTCNGAGVLDSGATDVSSLAFGLLEAQHASAIVATTHLVHAGAVFLMGQFLVRELEHGQPLHKALEAAQRRLRRITAGETVSLLMRLVASAPGVQQFLEEMKHYPPHARLFTGPENWAPFFILGNPNAKL